MAYIFQVRVSEWFYTDYNSKRLESVLKASITPVSYRELVSVKGKIEKILRFTGLGSLSLYLFAFKLV